MPFSEALPPPLSSHLVLIPSYNPGPQVLETVRAARAQWAPVWVVVDGSTDGTAASLQALAAADADLRVIVLPENRGKGAAVLAGITEAAAAGYTHVLTMDSDGQHPDLHGGVAGRAGRDGARQARVRAGGAGLARQGPQGVERLGQPGDAVDGRRRFPVRLPCLSHWAADAHHAA